MRLTRESKYGLLLLSVLVFGSCHYRSEQDILQGHWKYNQVQKNGKSAFPISDNDILVISSDKSFKYDIESVNKHLSGTWTYTDHTLHLKYQNPDTLRHFNIDILSNKALKMHEGDMYFYFTRIIAD